MNLADRIRQICALRRAWTQPFPTRVSDARVREIRSELELLGEQLLKLFQPEYWCVERVEISVGRGSVAQVPWICLLAHGQTVQEGVYIGIAFDKESRGVVVGLLKSATMIPGIPIPTIKRTPLIDGQLDINGAAVKCRYNDLYFNPREFYAERLDETELVAHLRESLLRYQEFLAEDSTAPITVTPTPRRVRELPHEPERYSPTETHAELTALVPQFQQDLEAAGLFYDAPQLTRYLAALLAKPFVVLAGLSGTGKTRLANALAVWLGAERTLVAVGADWTSSDRLLGYPDALDPTRYVRTPTLELILRAASNPTRPHLLILDELNLSPVERYGADLLSAMESGEPLHLHSDGGPRGGVPSTIALPPNLWIIGTINADETTHALSPKVLDRASLLSFPAPELTRFLQAPRRPELATLAGRGAHYASALLHLARTEAPPPSPELLAGLTQLQTTLQTVGFAFGYRVALDSVRLAAAYHSLTGANYHDTVLDAVVVQKVLPRLQGTPRLLAPVIAALLPLAERWPLARRRLEQMQTRLDDTGFLGFGEA